MQIDKVKKNITIIIVSHKGREKVIKFVKVLSKKLNILIIDNSKDIVLKKKLKKFQNIKVLFMKNNGYGAAINYARKFVTTEYIFAFSPDVQGVNNRLIFEFYKKTISKFNFGALGPRFLNVTQKSHVQSDIKKKIGDIKAISGSAIFINLRAFDKVNGFDENIFLFFEENDFCKRLRNIGYKIYQLNNTFIKHPKGVRSGVVKISRNAEFLKLEQLYNWHFLWSKFYFFKKNYGKLLTLIIFIPIIVRTCFRIFINSLLKKTNTRKKYLARFNGLHSSIIGRSSFKRL